MIVVALIGEPGVGKSSLASALGLRQIPTVRVQVAGSAGLAAEGMLVADAAASNSVLGQLNGVRARAVVLDGFPRTPAQARSLLDWCASRSGSVLPVHVEADPEALGRRRQRRGQTDGRQDDRIEVLLRRVSDYRDLTRPALDLLAAGNPVLRLQDADVASAAEEILRCITQREGGEPEPSQPK